MPGISGSPQNLPLDPIAVAAIMTGNSAIVTAATAPVGLIDQAILGSTAAAGIVGIGAVPGTWAGEINFLTAAIVETETERETAATAYGLSANPAGATVLASYDASILEQKRKLLLATTTQAAFSNISLALSAVSGALNAINKELIVLNGHTHITP